VDGKWSARRGHYRVIWAINVATEIVTVLYISHRRDSYR
jgi:mRNA-degrading endonuclease RelE of RelBE toxin-antitoxin system